MQITCTRCGCVIMAAQYCDRCGAKVHRACRGCGMENRPEAKFCAGCGSAFERSEPAVAAALPDTAAAQLKQVTVLFADICGFDGN